MARNLGDPGLPGLDRRSQVRFLPKQIGIEEPGDGEAIAQRLVPVGEVHGIGIVDEDDHIPRDFAGSDPGENGLGENEDEQDGGRDPQEKEDPAHGAGDERLFMPVEGEERFHRATSEKGDDPERPGGFQDEKTTQCLQREPERACREEGANGEEGESTCGAAQGRRSFAQGMTQEPEQGGRSGGDEEQQRGGGLLAEEILALGGVDREHDGGSSVVTLGGECNRSEGRVAEEEPARAPLATGPG